MKRLIWLAALTALVLLGPAPASAFDFSTIQNRVHKFTLDNGLTVIVMEDKSAPVVTCVTWANVGSVDDPKGQTGLAHIFEHMAFKGSKEVGVDDPKKEEKALAQVDLAFGKLRSELLRDHLADSTKVAQYRSELAAAQEAAGAFVVPNEFGRIVESEGGVGLNAGTGTDQTVYFFSLPSNRLELWFALESGRFYEPVLREFYKEKNVVMEERRMRVESSPFGKLFEEFLGTAYKAHPYGIRGIGHMSDLDMITRDEALAFYRKYYVPSNLVISIAGDVEVAEVEKFARTYFGRLPKAPRPERIGTVEPPQLGERRVAVEDRAQPILLIGYHRPANTHPEDAALNALADYLGEGRTSVLYKKLVKEDKIAVQAFAGATFIGGKYPDIFLAGAVPAQGVTAQECEKVILEQIEKVKEALISAEELQNIKARAKARFTNQLDSRQGMAMQLAAYETLYGDWRAMFGELDKINAVTAEDIQRVAREYLVRTNRTVAYIETVEES